MSSLWLAGLIPLLLWLLWLMGRLRARRRRWHERRRGLAQIGLLRALLEQMQQHRGLMYGLMSGEVSLSSQCWTLQQQIARLLEQTQQHEASLFWYTAWHHMQSEWQGIIEQARPLSPEQVLTAHHRLIDYLLDTVAAIAERHDLVLFGQLGPSREGCWLDLLRNTELLGRARATGTGIAARRQNTPMQREELSRLAQRIDAEAYLVLSRLHADPVLRPVLKDAVREAEEALDAYRQGIQRLLQDQKSLGSMAYFTLATQAISAQFALADILLERLRASSKQGLSARGDAADS